MTMISASPHDTPPVSFFPRLAVLKRAAIPRAPKREINMSNLEPLEDLIYDTLRQGRIFADYWEEAAVDTTGRLRRLWPATITRLKEGDCLEDQDTDVLKCMAEAILKARTDIKAKLGEPGGSDRDYLCARKIQLDLLMVYFGSFWKRRQMVFDRRKTEQLYGGLF